MLSCKSTLMPLVMHKLWTRNAHAQGAGGRWQILVYLHKANDDSFLHGIPILVKDNIATKDNLDASAGSYALLGAKAAVESSLISKLRDTGAIILGKTNLSEWANFRGLNITAGWSPRGGQTLGTYYSNGNPEGSSAGSAVATTLGLCVAALGTEVNLSFGNSDGLLILERRLEAFWTRRR